MGRGVSARADKLRRTLSISIDGRLLQVDEGTTVAAAILNAGSRSRISARGEPRQPVCGMGICYECRAEIDGRPHQRTCQMLCYDGMRVKTG